MAAKMSKLGPKLYYLQYLRSAEVSRIKLKTSLLGSTKAGRNLYLFMIILGYKLESNVINITKYLYVFLWKYVYPVNITRLPAILWRIFISFCKSVTQCWGMITAGFHYWDNGTNWRVTQQIKTDSGSAWTGSHNWLVHT